MCVSFWFTVVACAPLFYHASQTNASCSPGVFYATNYAPPGNGHDLSCLSGLVCAHAIGAAYPFESNDLAKLDFERLQDSMGCDHQAPRLDMFFPGLALLGLGGYALATGQ